MTPLVDSELSRTRCDGCGEETIMPETHFDDDGDLLATYCPGCELRRKSNDIEPGDHEQYKLDDELDRGDGLETDGGSSQIPDPDDLPADIRAAVHDELEQIREEIEAMGDDR